jgi:signal transduction histidine kinase
MRLIIKTTLLYLLLAVPVFAIGGIITYQMVKKEVRKETDYYLFETFQSLIKAIESGRPIDVLDNDKVMIWELDGDQWEEARIYSDTLGRHPHLDELEPYRKLEAVARVGDRFYRFSLIDVLIESDDMYKGVVKIISRLFLFLCLTMLAFAFLISGWLLRPFHKTLQSIRSFNLKSDEPLELPRTTTREFRTLNEFVRKMIAKVRTDYRTLKEFAENASHEMQTPIAIAKGRMELLLESEELGEKQLELIQSAHQSLSKLSRIGQSLSLLTRIDNQEFSTQQITDFSKTVANALSQFEELAALKDIRMESRLDEHVEKRIDPMLADILVANLMKNAIRHNEQNGWIEVILTDSSLTIRNSGKAPGVPTEQLFERFRKGNQSSSSLGLGLAIVKKICEVNDWQVRYDYEQETHEVEVVF